MMQRAKTSSTSAAPPPGVGKGKARKAARQAKREQKERVGGTRDLEDDFDIRLQVLPLLHCSECDQDLPRDTFTRSQVNKKSRRCRTCTGDSGGISSSGNKNATEEEGDTGDQRDLALAPAAPATPASGSDGGGGVSVGGGDTAYAADGEDAYSYEMFVQTWLGFTPEQRRRASQCQWDFACKMAERRLVAAAAHNASLHAAPALVGRTPSPVADQRVGLHSRQAAAYGTDMASYIVSCNGGGGDGGGRDIDGGGGGSAVVGATRTGSGGSAAAADVAATHALFTIQPADDRLETSFSSAHREQGSSGSGGGGCLYLKGPIDDPDLVFAWLSHESAEHGRGLEHGDRYSSTTVAGVASETIRLRIRALVKSNSFSFPRDELSGSESESESEYELDYDDEANHVGVTPQSRIRRLNNMRSNDQRPQLQSAPPSWQQGFEARQPQQPRQPQATGNLAGRHPPRHRPRRAHPAPGRVRHRPRNSGSGGSRGGWRSTRARRAGGAGTGSHDQPYNPAAEHEQLALDALEEAGGGVGGSRSGAEDGNAAESGELWQQQRCCPICLDLLSSPTTISRCGHVFCQLCIQTHLLMADAAFATMANQNDNRTCPLCRGYCGLDGCTLDTELNKALQAKFPALSKQRARATTDSSHGRATARNFEHARHRYRLQLGSEWWPFNMPGGGVAEQWGLPPWQPGGGNNNGRYRGDELSTGPAQTAIMILVLFAFSVNMWAWLME